jgi:hypothetical protein
MRAASIRRPIGGDLAQRVSPPASMLCAPHPLRTKKVPEDDFDDDGFARQPRPLRPRGKRVKIHQHSQHTVVEYDGPYGPVRVESSTTITIEIVEDDLPPHRFDDGFSQPALRRLPKARRR